MGYWVQKTKNDAESNYQRERSAGVNLLEILCKSCPASPLQHLIYKLMDNKGMHTADRG